ncbi:MAG: hypothetical protein AB1847_01940 [bacterium]
MRNGKFGVAILSIVVVKVIVLAVYGVGQTEIMVDYQKNGIQLSWTEPNQRITGERLFSSEIAGYNIFRSLDGEGTFRKINDQLVKDVFYIDQSIERGMCYSYALTTVDKQGLEGPRSSIVQAIPPLGPPSNVEAFGLKRSVRLTWRKTNNPKIRGYHIYRSEAAAGMKMLKIASVLDTDHEYLDQDTVPGKNYYYRISTVDISWQESALSEEVAATSLLISQEELAVLERVNGFRISVDHGAVILRWEPVAMENLAGYNVYRRTKEDEARGIADYRMLNSSPLMVTTFLDEDVKPQKSYYYLIAAVDKDKNEARFPKELYVTVADLYISSLTDDSRGLPLKGGKSLTITMIASSGKNAFVSIGDSQGATTAPTQNIPLRETDQEGIYYGQYTIPQDIERAELILTGSVQDDQGKRVEYVSKDKITIDNVSPEGVRSLKARVAEDAVCLTWDLAGQKGDIAAVKVFRSLTDAAKGSAAGGVTKRECAEGKSMGLIGEELAPGASLFCDQSFLPGQGYTYSVAVYDRAGNEALECLSLVTLPDSTPPKIYSVKELSAPGTKRLGDIIRIQMTGEPKAEGKFSIGSGISQVLQEIGPGLYRGEYIVQAGDDLLEEPVFCELVDPSGNRGTLSGDFTVSIDTTDNASRQPEIEQVRHNAFQLAGVNPLVAGDVLRISVLGETGCTAYVDLGALMSESQQGTTGVELMWDRNEGLLRSFEDDIVSYQVYCQQNPSSLINLFIGSQVPGVWPVAELPKGSASYRIENYRGGYLFVTAKKSAGDEQVILTPRMHIPLEEVSPGLYEGTYEVQPGDYVRDGKITAYLVNRQGERSLPALADSTVTIDTTVAIAVTPEEKCLKADGKSRTDVRIEVKDARQVGVGNREVAIELFTTDEYTGIAGVGRFDESKYGYLDNFYQLVTDFAGQVKVPYVSGLAAKTLIMRAKDLVTGCVGIGYITSYIEGVINIQLLTPPNRQRMRGIQSGPTLQVWADREWLTADDGHSRTDIHAKVLDEQGHPLEGHHISFSITSGEGRIEEIIPTSNSSGEALARYFSGKHIGTVEITAVDTSMGLSRKVYIVLKSDAPSKIELQGAPLTIWADGASTTDLTIRVGDINDNPNRGIPLEVEIIQGGGKLILLNKEAVTDFHGECRLKYLAGTKPETVTIRARALSSIPDSKVLDRIRIAEKGLY